MTPDTTTALSQEQTDFEAVQAENNRPSRKQRRNMAAYLRQNQEDPGDEKFARGSRSQAKLAAKRLFEERRAREAEARTRGWNPSKAKSDAKQRWPIHEFAENS